MSEYEALKILSEEYEKKSAEKSVKKEEKKKGKKELFVCKHEEFSDEKGITVCINCGEQIEREHELKTMMDHSRIQTRKEQTKEKTIYADVENMGFPANIVMKANELYIKVTGENIYRGGNRKGIIYACVFYAYNQKEIVIMPDELQEIFGLERRECLGGIKHMNRFIGKNSDIRTQYVRPIDTIKYIGKKFSFSDAVISELEDIYNQVDKKSSMIERSRPKSIAAGIIYYWIVKKGKNSIGIKQYVDTVNISELTINKMKQEIERLLNKKKPNTLGMSKN